ncbi:hypothetical protein LNTAR_18238 [Lentisphaera araneosa HTCC2155]|jgi:hypothetical protein|uniref:Uncharacterized protein n=1 Tax=Lentisphaera araneosa HTCC2155 TaxID=313628 RepID=A6DFY6_9BACT|nr:hypothetical protein [Lentisphaera araneosa]EDM29716.1 hypothetical protein LNTAR_18238 [Lentisphaera araneosa HTCC2155]
MALKKIKGKVRFPKRELNTWLKKNSEWNEASWEALITDLTDQGFNDWTSNQEGKDSIGLYIETNRK